MKFFAIVAALAVAANAQSKNATTAAPSTGGSAAAPAVTGANGQCLLQFTSPCTDKGECGDLNGFNMTCIKSGSNQRCGCAGGDSNCQKQSTSADVAYQFDECTAQRKCVAGNGFTALDADNLASKAKTCGEPLFCVQERNPDAAAVLKSQCHTCGSCKSQNVKAEKDSTLT
ncbi:hypothetical protein As57867_010289, partial [Aphanomyces stellatus]